MHRIRNYCLVEVDNFFELYHPSLFSGSLSIRNAHTIFNTTELPTLNVVACPEEGIRIKCESKKEIKDLKGDEKKVAVKKCSERETEESLKKFEGLKKKKCELVGPIFVRYTIYEIYIQLHSQTQDKSKACACPMELCNDKWISLEDDDAKDNGLILNGKATYPFFVVFYLGFYVIL